MEALKKVTKLDDKGEMVTDENGFAEFADDEAKDRFQKEMNELMNQEIEMPKISLESLQGVNIDVMTLVPLEDIITE